MGEHDTADKTETIFTKVYEISEVRKHEDYDSDSVKRENDIAIVFTRESITFNDGVGPSCLPFL